MKSPLLHRPARTSMLLGLVILASGFSLGCPGQLPCLVGPNGQLNCNDSPAYPADAAVGQVAAPVTVNANTAIAGCARWPTLGAMDAFFASRCGIAASCHGNGTAYTDLGSPFAWVRLPLANAKVSCKGALVANTRSWRDSVLWAKTQTPVACPPGATTMGGQTMPPQMAYDPKTPVLNLDEITCLQGFLTALAGR
jgi:hypothetical protein